jgi:translation elongation factor EF-4
MQILGEYTAKAYKEMEHRRGISWRVNIYKGTKKVGYAKNEGCGGCTDFNLPEEISNELVELVKKVKFPSKHHYSDTELLSMDYLEASIHTLCDNFNSLKIIKKKINLGKTVVQLKDVDDYEVYNVGFDQSSKTALSLQLKGNVAFFYNEAIEKYGNKIGDYIKTSSLS